MRLEQVGLGVLERAIIKHHHVGVEFQRGRFGRGLSPGGTQPAEAESEEKSNRTKRSFHQSPREVSGRFPAASGFSAIERISDAR